MRGLNSRPLRYKHNALPTELMEQVITFGGGRTRNLWFRRPAPYPLGHKSIASNRDRTYDLAVNSRTL